MCMVHVAHIRLAPSTGRPLEVVDVYLPGIDKLKSNQSYKYIITVAAHCKPEEVPLLVGGDFNATLFPRTGQVA